MPLSTRAKRRITLLIGVVVIAGVGLVGAKRFRTAQRARMATDARQVGEQARRDGKHKLAVKKLGYYLRYMRDSNDDKPTDGELWLQWVDSRRRVPEENGKHLIQAIFGAKQARLALPGDVRPLEALLDLYWQIGRHTERLEVADAILKIDPSHYDAGQARTVSLWSLGRVDEALEAAKASSDSHPQSREAAETLIELMVNQKVPAEEIIAYAHDRAMAMPDNLAFKLLEARVNLSSGRLDEGRKIVSQAIKMNTDEADLLSELLNLLDALDMNDESQSVLEKALATAAPGGDAFVIAAQRAWKAGRANEAKTILTDNPAPPEDVSDEYLGWWAMLDWEDSPEWKNHPALVELRQRSGVSATSWALLLDGYDNLRQKQWGLAREALSSAVTGDRQNTLAAFFLGETKRHLGEASAAIDLWTRLARREPRWVRLHYSLATLLLSQSRAEDAFAAAVYGYQHAPEKGSMTMILAKTAVAVLEAPEADPARLDFAMRLLGQLQEQAPKNADVQALIIRSFAATGRNDEAKRLLSDLIDSDAQFSAGSISELAKLSQRSGWGLEDQLIATGEKASPRDPNLLFTAAVNAAQSGRTQEGERMLQNAIDKAEDDASRLALHRRMAAYLDITQDSRALDAYRDLADANAKDSQIQLEALVSKSAWTDEDFISRLIARVRGVAGEGSAVWRTYEARRLLSFEPSEKNAGQAILLLTQVIKNDPNAIDARLIAADAEMLLGDRLAAIRLLTEAISSDRTRWRLYPRLIALLQKAGDSDTAAQYLRDFAEAPDVSDALLRRRAQLLAAQGMWELAVRDARTFAQGGAPRDQLALANLLLKQGELDKAGAIFEGLLNEDQTDPEILGDIANYYALRGQLDKGRAILERVPDDPPGQRVAMLSSYLERIGSQDEAERIVDDWAKRQGTADAWNLLARVRVRAGKYQEATEALKKGLAIDPDDVALKATQSAMAVAVGSGADSQAMSNLLESVASANLSKPMRAMLDVLDAQRRDQDNLEAHIKRVRKLTEEHPTFFPAWRLLVQALLAKGSSSDAIDAALAAVQASPTDPAPAQLAARLLAADKQYERAISLARQWRLRSLENPVDAELFLASLELQTGHADDGLDLLSGRLALLTAQATQKPDGLTLYANLLAHSGQVTQASDLLWPLSQRDVDWARRSARIAASLGDYPAEARQWLKRLTPKLGNDSEDSQGRMTLGLAWYQLGVATGDADDHRNAIATLEPVMEEDSSGAAAALVAASSEQLGELDKAEQLYRQAISKAPDHAAALNNLAYLLIKRNSSLDESLELATRAVEIAPNEPSYLDTKATALLRLGRYDEAADIFQRALSLDVTSPALLVGLAETRLNQSRYNDAREILDRAQRMANTGATSDPALTTRVNDLRKRLAAVDQP